MNGTCMRCIGEPINLAEITRSIHMLILVVLHSPSPQYKIYSISRAPMK